MTRPHCVSSKQNRASANRICSPHNLAASQSLIDYLALYLLSISPLLGPSIMASLNLSTNGPSINSSYKGVINSPAPSGPAANSATYGQWALFSVSAPLVSAFQQDAGGKESVLKVQSTGGKPIGDPKCQLVKLILFYRG
jgi:hypothetical protein